MAEFALNPNLIDTIKTTAVAKAASAVAQRFSPASIKKVQQLLQLKGTLESLFGDGGGDAQPLLGGMSLDAARDMYQQMQDAQLARGNLYFIRVVDWNPPPVEYAPGAYYTSLFNLFALEVSYSPNTLTGEKVPIGSAVMDRVTGTEATDLSITMLDDSVGSVKRWFEAKHGQAAHSDGTFGVPSDYWVDFEITHAIAVDNPDAYTARFRMRTQSIRHALSRRDQALQELEMNFTQTDSFLQL